MANKISELTIEYVETIPEEIGPGILFISEKYDVAIHLCACGCGGKTVTPLGEGWWTLTKNGDKVSLSPSIGNWIGEDPYHAHYFIRENKIDWA